jgi:hypothetical protein
MDAADAAVSSRPDQPTRRADQPHPTITARFSDGPLRGSSVEVEPVEGRPPKTVDVPCTDGTTYRYCLEEWAQPGASARYGFLYPV